MSEEGKKKEVEVAPGSDLMPHETHSHFEPSEDRPGWALTPEEFVTVTCEECGELFAKDGANGVVGGIIVLNDIGSIRRYYHGYLDSRGSCYDKAEKKDFPKKEDSDA